MARIDLGGIRTKAGIPGDNLPGWWNRERPGRFEPVGIMVHHDAGVTDKQAINAAVNGRPDLAGPLYASVTTRTGDVIVVSGGRTNHAGLISSAVVSETEHNIAPSTSAKVRRLIDDVSGNELYIGHCIANNGVDEPYPGIQLTNTARFCAAVCAHEGWSANRVIGHAEATRRKIDPSTSMAALRLEIAHLLSAGQTGPPAPVTVVLEEADMRHTTLQIKTDGEGRGYVRWPTGLAHVPRIVGLAVVGTQEAEIKAKGWEAGQVWMPGLDIRAIAEGSDVLVTVQGAPREWIIGVNVSAA